MQNQDSERSMHRRKSWNGYILFLFQSLADWSLTFREIGHHGSLWLSKTTLLIVSVENMSLFNLETWFLFNPAYVFFKNALFNMSKK